MDQLAQAKAAVETMNKGMEAANKALDLFDRGVDRLIPWETFEKTINELKRGKKEFSSKAGDLVGSVETLLLNSRDQYMESTQSVYEWCSVAAPLLTGYLRLFEDHNEAKASAQQKIVLKALDTGIERMTSAQQSLHSSSKSFNTASGELNKLLNQLKIDFEEGSAYHELQVDKIRKEAYAGAAAGAAFGPLGLAIAYAVAAGVVEGELIPALNRALESVKRQFSEMQRQADLAGKNISHAKDQLGEEIKSIGHIKSAAEVTVTWIWVGHDMLQELNESAGRLIHLCEEYMKRHQ